MNSLIVGALLTTFISLPDTGPDANAFGSMVRNAQQVELQLNVADGIHSPVLFIDQLYTDENGIYSYRTPDEITDAIKRSGHFGRIIFAFDEPYWRARHTGQNPEEVRMVMEMAQADFPTVEFMVIYAYAELYHRYVADPTDLKLWLGVEHVGMDCYGDWNGCGGGVEGVPDVPIYVYLEELYKIIQVSGSSAKLFLVPGAFTVDWINGMNTQEQAVQHIDDYVTWAKDNSEKISGFGAFVWDDFNGIIGAKNLPLVKEKLLWAFKEMRNISND